MIEALIGKGDFKTLFIERLGWDHARGVEVVDVDGETIQVNRIAHKRGFQVFEHRARSQLVQTLKYVRQVQERVSQLAHEHILIVADQESRLQVWAWGFRDHDKNKWNHRFHPCFTDHIPDELIERISELEVKIEEEEEASLLGVAGRISSVFDDVADEQIFFRSSGYAIQSDILARRMRSGGTREFHEFVMFHKRLAKWFSRRYSRLTDELEDLEQVAMIGIIRAAKTYNPDGGAAFATYAFYGMQITCWRYLPVTLRMGRIPDNLYKPFMMILRRTEQAWIEGGPTRADDVFQQLTKEAGYTPDMAEDLRRYFTAQSLHPASMTSLARRVGAVQYEADIENRYREPLNDVIMAEQSRKLLDLVASLEPRDQMIVRRRFGLNGEEETLEEIGKRYHVSRQRILQLEVNVLRTLRRRACKAFSMDPSIFDDVENEETDGTAAD